MFNPTTNFGFSAVVFFLFFGQGGVAITFFTNFISDVFGEFLSCISTVGITYFIFFIEKHFKFIAVVYVGRRYCIIQNQLAFSINLNMILVTVMCFFTFFRPTGIGIFLKFFVGQFLSFLRNFAIFDLSVFITAISLTGCIYKCSIYNRAFVSNNTMVLNSKMQSYGGLPALLFLSLIKTDAMIGTIAQFT